MPALRGVVRSAGRELASALRAVRRGPELEIPLRSQVLLLSTYFHPLDHAHGPCVARRILKARRPRRFKSTGRPSRVFRPPTEDERALNSRICQAEDGDELLRLVHEEGHHFGFGNMATCINRLSRLPPTLYETVKRSASFKLLIRCLEAKLRARSADIDPRGLANTINGLAKLEYDPGQEFVEVFVHVCVAFGLKSFKPQELAMVINGLAKLDRHPGEQFLKLFSMACVALELGGFTGQGLGNVINGLAKFKSQPGEAFVDLFVQRCVNLRFRGFDTQHLANIINGLAKLGCRLSEDFLVRFVAACEAAGLGRFTPQELANVIDGLGKYEYYPGEVWMENFILACMQKGLHSFRPPELTGLISGLALLHDAPPADFIARFIEACVGQLERCGEQALGTILASFAHLGLPLEDEHWERLFSALAKLPSPSVQCMTSVVWAAAVYNRHDHLAKVGALQALGQAHVGSTAPHIEDNAFGQAIKQALYSLDQDKKSAARQLLQSILTLIPPQGQVVTQPRYSALQREVATVLYERLGLAVREEQVIADGTILLDILLVPSDGSRRAPVGIEVDGPWHELFSHPKVPTGTTLFKRRLLDLAVQRGELEAWVSVPYRAWYSLKGRLAQQTYIMKLMEARGVDLAEYGL